jgi:hypothetical protein
MPVPILKFRAHGIEGLSHCWAPVVNGKVVEYNGEPPRSVKGAKKAASVALGKPVEELEFEVRS